MYYALNANSVQALIKQQQFKKNDVFIVETLLFETL